MSKNEEILLKELLIKHIDDSNDWRKDTIETMKAMHDMTMQELFSIKKDVDRYNQYEVGAKALISFGKAVIYVVGIAGACWMFLHDYWDSIMSKLFGK